MNHCREAVVWVLLLSLNRFVGLTTFTENRAYWGGAINTYGTDEDPNAGLTFPADAADLVFENNSADVRSLQYRRFVKNLVHLATDRVAHGRAPRYVVITRIPRTLSS